MANKGNSTSPLNQVWFLKPNDPKGKTFKILKTLKSELNWFKLEDRRVGSCNIQRVHPRIDSKEQKESKHIPNECKSMQMYANACKWLPRSMQMTQRGDQLFRRKCPLVLTSLGIGVTTGRKEKNPTLKTVKKLYPG